MAPRQPRQETIELPQFEAETLEFGHELPERASETALATTSKEVYLKLISAAFSFFVAGVNDGSLGALIPHMLRSYNISSAIIAVIYIATFLGWTFASISNSFLTQIFDLGAMLVLGAVLQILGHALRVWLPPFPLFAIAFWFVSLGQAYQDTYANTFVASIKAAHRWLGLIHASYAGGCLVGPFVATAVASADDPSRWNLFYACPIGLGFINLMLTSVAFRSTFKLRQVLQPQVLADQIGSDIATTQRSGRARGAVTELKDTARVLNVWLLCLFFFCYLGAAITAGGWVVEYLVIVRKGDLSEMGYVPAGFNGGMFLGRLVLAEPTHRFGERRMLLIYCGLCLGFQLVFWLVPNIIAASVALSFLGFFLGPFLASGVSVAARILPEKIRSSGLTFMFVTGQAGGSLFPAITGIIAAHAGVKVLQPMLVGLLAATGVSWLLVPTEKVLHQE